ncbi:MAG TPA: nucleoside deaminase [Pyrinomonadaceae bacterium]|jgi:tRNA(Arg) A34 adenosine deaminase TadA|nr:nucleoside deaminase [Pyrinomonadaceae bacterium]
MMDDKQLMLRAIELAQKGLESNEGGPFGCVIARDGQVVGEGVNRVTSTNDPTAHAEVVAIRDACRNLNSFQLDGCVVYTSCEPCPMCLGAIYWARPERIYIACDRNDAADAGFDDAFIYDELCGSDLENRKVPIVTLLKEEGLRVFENWIAKPDKIEY